MNFGQGIPLGRQSREGCKKNCNAFLERRLAERDKIGHDEGHLWVAGQLLFWWTWSRGPAVPCGDKHQSFTDAFVHAVCFRRSLRRDRNLNRDLTVAVNFDLWPSPSNRTYTGPGWASVPNVLRQRSVSSCVKLLSEPTDAHRQTDTNTADRSLYLDHNVVVEITCVIY